MDGTYDVIVMGTGLTECILSGMLSVSGKKVLHLDRNNYYGGVCASFPSVDQLYRHFGREPAGEKYAKEGNWNVDLIPKFFLANSRLTQLLIYTQATRDLEFKAIDDSYVSKGNGLFKVPFDKTGALQSPLMGLFEKRRLKEFLFLVQDYDEHDPATWKGIEPHQTARDLYKKFSLKDDTKSFVGHALALYRNDEYLENPLSDLVKRIQLYVKSLHNYGAKSPYLYPIGGLGRLPQSVARIGSVYGNTFILGKPTLEIVMKDGKVVGVTDKKNTAKCHAIVCDPSYAPERCKKVGQVVRAICILNHPIPNTEPAQSVQIIIPQKQAKRKNDIFVCMVSSDNNACPQNFYIATVATTVETDNPEAELQPGLEFLGPIEDKFVSTMDLYEPVDDGRETGIFVSRSYDATTHFETTCDDVLGLFKRITGSEFDFREVKGTLNEDN